MKKNTKRRVMSAILAAVMTLSVGVTATVSDTASISASAADGYSDNFDYSYDFLNDGTIEISGYFGNDTDILVPSEINGYTVSSVGFSAFYDSSISSVKIPSSVKKIGESAFENCTLLKSVTMPSSVTEIGESAFKDCTSLKSVTIPSGVKSIGDFAFTNCTSLKNINVSSSNKYFSSINGVVLNKAKTELILCPAGRSGEYEIPKTVTKIRYAAFFFCTSLTYVEIPNSVKDIGIYAFAGCDSIAAINIPNSVTEIKEGTFASCSSLELLVMSNSVKIIRKNAFEDCYGLIDVYFVGKESEYNNILMNGEGNYDFLGAVVTYATYKASSLSINKISDQTYTGKAITPAVTVKDGCKTLKKGTDYTVSYKNNTKMGTATVTITGKGNYSGTKTATFKIVAPKVAKPTNLKATQTTNSVKLSWKKASGATSYGVYVYDTKTKKYKGLATVTGTSYTAKNLKAGTTYKFVVRSNKKVGGTTFHSSNTAITTATKTATPTMAVKAVGSKRATVTWKKVSGATGYEIFMSTKKTSGFKKVATVSASKTAKYTKTGLTKGKTYYFRVRTYKTVGKTKIYSGYQTKAVKIK